MTTVQAPESAPPVSGWAVWPLRVVVSVVALLVLVQPVLAGLFVTGDVGMLDLHSIIASFLVMLVFLQIVAAILLWRPGRGPAWPIAVSVGNFVLAELQSGLGYARVVAAHIPLGVLLFGFSVAFLVGVWSPRLRRRRSVRGSRAAR